MDEKNCGGRGGRFLDDDWDAGTTDKVIDPPPAKFCVLLLNDVGNNEGAVVK